ncbi:MAG: restriction endonuclease [Candidatus Paceibacterota bacterium]
MSNINVINFRGEEEPFSEKKVYESARRVGASEQTAEEITETIKEEVYDGIETSEIYNRIKELLNEKSNKLGMKFSLKKGMRKLGPTGFPFEKFVGEIFHRLGYNVELNLYLEGKCLDEYETDFIAEKDNIINIGECKFRIRPEESVIELDTVQAFQAQMQDLRNGTLFNEERFKNKEIRTLLVTNSKFSNVATEYADCVGIDLLGWRTPEDKGLETIIDNNGFYPITILPSLDRETSRVFIQRKMTLVQNLLELDKKEFIKQNNIEKEQLEKLIREVKVLLD